MARKNLIVIKSMSGTNFAAGNVVTVIHDARDIGVQLAANSGGSFYFTLPLDHPALPLILPIQQHYFVQKWDPSTSTYITIQGGIITDYDAGQFEVVISGVDYMTALNKYYTPVHGPALGEKAIPNEDTTVLFTGVTPKSIISAAITKDTNKRDQTWAAAITDSAYDIAGKIRAYSGVPLASSVPDVAGADKLSIVQEEVSGVKTGAIIISGCLYIGRSGTTVKFSDGKTGKEIYGNLAISGSTSGTTAGRIGFVLYASPGGPLLDYYQSVYIAAGSVDIGMSNNYPQSFSIKLRPVSHYDAADEDHTGSTRTMSILTEGVTYDFYAIPYYRGRFDPVSATYSTFVDYSWGNSTGSNNTTYTAGLTSDTIQNTANNLFVNTTDPLYSLDRSGDYTGTPKLKPIVSFMTVEHISGSSSSTKHPFVSAGQGPVDLLRDLVDLEVGTRTDGSKIVFNFYGVPSGAADGTKLSINHLVSNSTQATFIFPGSIKDFNITNKLSSKINSARIIPTTAFLIGATTEGASGVKSKGVVKNPSYSATDPALPLIVAQRGFISAQSASNFAQGIINDYGTNDRIRDVRVSLRTEQYGPIGMPGTPKLGETVKVVINRQSANVASSQVVETYNVNGMQWHINPDGHEDLMLDLIKPSMFKGPAVTWENKPSPNPTPNTEPRIGGATLPDPIPVVNYDAAGNVITGTPTGTSFMYVGTSGGKVSSTPTPIARIRQL
jgi:hypothetical protein